MYTDELGPVSSRLVSVRVWARLPFLAVLIIVAVFAGFVLDRGAWGVITGALLLVVFVWQCWLIPMQVRHHRWKETDEELVISSGKFWHSLSVIPYGRIQYVDVSQGTIERRFRLKSLRVNTASPMAGTTIYGLDEDLADALRQRVAERAKAGLIDL